VFSDAAKVPAAQLINKLLQIKEFYSEIEGRQ
jgi:hypothetical protein